MGEGSLLFDLRGTPARLRMNSPLTLFYVIISKIPRGTFPLWLIMLTCGCSLEEPTTYVSYNVTISAPVNTYVEGGGEPPRFVIELDSYNNTGGDIIIEYFTTGTATPDQDYRPLEGKAHILAGQSRTEIEINVLEDSEPEPEETLTITLSSSSPVRANVNPGDQISATITIVDND